MEELNFFEELGGILEITISLIVTALFILPALIIFTFFSDVYGFLLKKLGKDFTIDLEDVPIDKEVIFFPTNNNNNILKLVLQTMKSVDKYLLIKPHPKEDVKKLLEIIGSYRLSNVFIVHKETGIKECIFRSSLTFIHTSTVGVESMIAGVPIILINPYKEIFSKLGYYDNNLLLKAKDSDSLVKLTNKFFGVKE